MSARHSRFHSQAPQVAIKKNRKRSTWLKFIIPSLIGVGAFLVPISYQGQWTILMAVLSDVLKSTLGSHMIDIVMAIITFSAAMTLYVSLANPRWVKRVGFVSDVFSVKRSWVVLRVLGWIIGLMIYFQVGPSWIWAEHTGVIVLHDLATSIVTIFLFAAILLPLLTDYGLMEFIGTLLERIFRFLFRIPGRASIDATASWLSSAPVGILLTSQQYERGYYSGRDSAIIATNFSIVSLPFTLVVAEFAGLRHLFIEYYLTVVVAGILTAVILPRLPPLSRIPDTYCTKDGKRLEDLEEQAMTGQSLLARGLDRSLKRAERAPSGRQLIASALRNVCDIWFGLMPPLIAIATLGLVIAEFTPIMVWLSYPLIPLLELLQLPEASQAAPAFLVGFAEMFLPAVIAASIDSELTRFVIIAVSINQLIYMSEVGVLILKVKIPLNIFHLITIFLLRTFISLPIIAAIAHLVVFR